MLWTISSVFFCFGWQDCCRHPLASWTLAIKRRYKRPICTILLRFELVKLARWREEEWRGGCKLMQRNNEYRWTWKVLTRRSRSRKIPAYPTPSSPLSFAGRRRLSSIVKPVEEMVHTTCKISEKCATSRHSMSPNAAAALRSCPSLVLLFSRIAVTVLKINPNTDDTSTYNDFFYVLHAIPWAGVSRFLPTDRQGEVDKSAEDHP